jgi:hypothetical protein
MVSFNHALRGAVVAVALLAPASSAFAQSDAQIRQKLIAESIASYPGNCPCPYNSASNGSSCGKRSAWSRAGGYAPLCYASDVTPEMIREYRQSRRTR